MFKPSKWTNTARFLIPAFGIRTDVLVESGYINAYLEDVHKCHDSKGHRLIYALFKPEKDQIPGVQAILGRWDKQGFVLDDYDYSGGYVVIVLKFPRKYEREFELFLEGKYSQFSTEYKKLFPQRAGDQDSLFYHIFNKTETIREFLDTRMGGGLLDEDSECWDKPVMKDVIIVDDETQEVRVIYGETLNIDTLIEYKEDKESV